MKGPGVKWSMEGSRGEVVNGIRRERESDGHME